MQGLFQKILAMSFQDAGHQTSNLNRHKKPILTLYNPVGCGVFLNPIFKTTFGPLPHSWSLAIAGQSCNHGTRAFPPDWSRKPWSLAWCSWRWMQTSREWLRRSLMSGANKSLNKLHVTTVILYHYIIFIFFSKFMRNFEGIFFSIHEDAKFAPLTDFLCERKCSQMLHQFSTKAPKMAPHFVSTAVEPSRCVPCRTHRDISLHGNCGWENCLPNFDLRDNFLR